MNPQIIEAGVEKRKIAGAELAARDGIVLHTYGNTWNVKSIGSRKGFYTVKLGTYSSCTCEDFQKRGAWFTTCKHIEACRIYNSAFASIERHTLQGVERYYANAFKGGKKYSEYQELCFSALAKILKSTRQAAYQQAG